VTGPGPAGLSPEMRALCVELDVDPEAVVSARDACWDEGVAAAVEECRPVLSARLVETQRSVCSAVGCAERAAGTVGEAGRWCPAHLAAVEAVRSAVTQRADRWVAARLVRHRYEP